MAAQNPSSKKWPKYSERVKGDGSVSRFVYPTVNGKPHWRRIPDDPEWKGKKGYERFLQKVIKEESTASTDTFAPVAKKWLKQYQNGKYNTYKGYKVSVENHLIPRFGKLKCRDIKSSDIQALINDVLLTYSTETAKSLVARTAQILETMVVDERLPRNPARVRFRYATDKTPTKGRALSVEEFRLLQSNLTSRSILVEDLQLANETAIETGLRVSELLAMKWEYLDADKGEYFVKEQLAIPTDPKTFTTPKTASSSNSVKIRPALMKKLLAYKSSQAERRLATTNWADHDLLFCHKDGTPVHQSLFWSYISNAAKRADLGRVTPHDLRHTCASLLIAANTPIQIVSRQLRHRNISMTWDVYGHLYPQDLDQVADTMEALFG